MILYLCGLLAGIENILLDQLPASVKLYRVLEMGVSMDYSNMGRRSWQEFEKRHGKTGARRKMADKGRKGWQALVNKLGSEEAARFYVGQIGKANFFNSTRPGFARGLVEPYFDTFPTLKDKFTGDKT